MSEKKTREEMYETILEMWGEGWESNSLGDVWDELMGLHTGEKPLYQWSDDEIDVEYENALEYFADQDRQDVPDYGDRI